MALENPKPFDKQIFIQAKNLRPGDTLKGHLVGDWTGGKFKKRDIVFKASEDFSVMISREKDAAPELVTIEEGMNFVVPASGTLSKFWEEMDSENGTLARTGVLYHIVYGGKSKITKGQWKGQEAHTFEVLRDTENVIPVAGESSFI